MKLIGGETLREKTFFVTTPIYYPNGKPHIGSVYTTLLADFFARFNRLLGKETFFLTGTDEHGLKLYRAAQKAGKQPKEYVDEMSQYFKDAWSKLNIEYDRFIRTTDPDHEETVKYIVERIYENGYIYPGKYSGWYCVSCETYYDEEELIKEGDKYLCPIHRKPVEFMEEETHFFKLSTFKNEILKLINNGLVQPEKYAKGLLARLQNLQDISMTRTKDRVPWGIEFPVDKRFTVYVWFDALVNYISGIGYPHDMRKFNKFWPAVHIIGKDILWFHAVVWPAMLLAAGIKHPKKILVHGFWTVEGVKMGKSLGNVVYYDDLLKYHPDVVRYYLLKSGPVDKDGNFSWNELKEVYKNELSNEIGNLVRRVTLFAKKNYPTIDGELDENLMNELKNHIDKAKTSIEKFVPSQYTVAALSIFKTINRYFTEKEPWKTNDKNAVYNSLAGIEIGALVLYPVMPEISRKILESIGVDLTPLLEYQKKTFTIKDSPILFPKLGEY